MESMEERLARELEEMARRREARKPNPRPARAEKQGARRMFREIKDSCIFAERDLPKLRELAADHGITVSFSVVKCSKRAWTYHFMFEDTAGRIMDYWPATGTFFSSRGSVRGKVADWWLALDEAARISVGDAVAEAEKHLDAISRE
jgi:hypothetical protein